MLIKIQLLRKKYAKTDETIPIKLHKNKALNLCR